MPCGMVHTHTYTHTGGLMQRMLCHDLRCRRLAPKLIFDDDGKIRELPKSIRQAANKSIKECIKFVQRGGIPQDFGNSPHNLAKSPPPGKVAPEINLGGG